MPINCFPSAYVSPKNQPIRSLGNFICVHTYVGTLAEGIHLIKRQLCNFIIGKLSLAYLACRYVYL